MPTYCCVTLLIKRCNCLNHRRVTVSITCQMPLWSKLQWFVPHLLSIRIGLVFLKKKNLCQKVSYFHNPKLPLGLCEQRRCWTSDPCLVGSPCRQRTLSLRAEWCRNCRNLIMKESTSCKARRGYRYNWPKSPCLMNCHSVFGFHSLDFALNWDNARKRFDLCNHCHCHWGYALISQANLGIKNWNGSKKPLCIQKKWYIWNFVTWPNKFSKNIVTSHLTYMR